MSDIHKIAILGKESIHCGFNLIPHVSHTLLTTLTSTTYVLITDTNLAPLYLQLFIDQFTQDITASFPDPNNRPRFLTHIIPPGETTKSREGKAEIEDFLLSQKCTRDTVILAFGGGVIGDLVGFVAATFMRGVRFVQVPTSLLAMVDSSVGGKTAIDTPLGKNLVGAFWQPEYIFIDVAFLATLPKRELANGLSEVIKTAAIWDEAAFALLESTSATLLNSLDSLPSLPLSALSSHPLLTLIISSVNTKSTIVTYDPKEANLRNLVNFGHTIGHAIEAFLTPYLLHGECVSVGMVLEAEVARGRGKETGLGQVGVGRLRRCIESYGLPTSLTHPLVLRAQAQALAASPPAPLMTIAGLLDRMSIDKKNTGSKLKKIVLLSRIGKTHELRATGVPDEEIIKVLAEGVTVLSGIPGGYIKPSLPKPLRELPGAAEKGPLHPQLIYPPASLDAPAVSTANGTAHITLATPGSKSISNRALVLAALSNGTVKLKNLLHSDDTQVMMAALEALKAATFEWTDNGETLIVTGSGGHLSLPLPGTELYLGNAGTAARFLTTVCTLVSPSSTSGQAASERTIITGNARMKQRPIAPLVEALSKANASIDYLGGQGCLPLAIAPTGLPGGTLTLDASISSQYVSSILLCAPYAREDTTLVLTGKAVISQLYIDMTIALMRDFGIEVTRERDPASGELLNAYKIPRGTYKVPSSGVFTIESDASSATYPLAIAAITGTTCTLSSIGSSSLQGDARFAKEVLEPMGCTVVQTATETTVTGPPIGTLKAMGEVDMEPMTDAFLTAAVVGAVATDGGKGGEGGEGKNVLRIRGIANQRVKECNRIKAMRDQLAKFGVETSEFEDGIVIYGRPLASLKGGASIHCYDDHRVAMAFSVLATVVDGTIIEEKRCVEKTWPNWWDDLENKIGIKVQGADIPHSHPLPALPATASPSKPLSPSTTPSILLIGMRGSGKSHIGVLASHALSLPLLDFDVHFASLHPPSLRSFVQTQGWAAFRAAETELLLSLLASHGQGWVISLGGGIVETPEAREALLKFGNEKGGKVVWVKRELEVIEKYLEKEGERPVYGEAVRDVFKRREPWFQQCAGYEFANYFAPGGVNVEGGSLDGEIERFFGHVSGLKPNLAPNVLKASEGVRSYFLSLTYPDIIPALPSIPELSTGVDALELRVDLLREPGSTSTIPSHDYVCHQIAALRRTTSLPVVFTVRTVSQGGAFPDNATKEAADLSKLALRLGCEYIDVETTLPSQLIKEIVTLKGASHIVASFHDWSGSTPWDSPTMSSMYAVAAQQGDIVKLISKATSFSSNFTLQSFVAKHTSKPLIAINMGIQGQLSRVLNVCFTPVTHPLLPSKAAPGQLSFVEIQQALHLSGLLPSKKFYLFGTPIAHSMSPTLHNTAFTTLGLPHVYSLLETPTVGDEIAKAIKSPDFGGASVTIPFKLDIIPLLDALSPAAQSIGAVNTVIPLPSGELYGENTDYLGIISSIRTRALGLVSGTLPAALVIGAGGTARAAVYALKAIGTSDIYVFNRTVGKAEALASAFQGGEGESKVRAVTELGTWPGVPPSVIISTVPADATSTTSSPSAIYLPPALFDSSIKGVVIDMAYRPSQTPLLQLAATTAPGWARVRGVEVLLEQGYVQFEEWTGRQCPKGIVRERVLARYDSSV
ncbi:aromatic amino acid family biosynthesis-like protein [Paxillus ammoniavirescens]|nr:aromatic amino acid family biosynthesis-like protein [Paxillus ammoniavirescens]